MRDEDIIHEEKYKTLRHLIEHYIYLSSLRKCSSVESNGIFHTTVLKDKIMKASSNINYSIRERM